ncbi:MAG: hypothetical protein ONA69_08145 [candidate division KSB1 bacterium]|nr:hypothetical protein [candidate division KSB1 bacterium]MDZ7346745.1 hypothetical protein [candidate division KSB1 bacterium]MDZ7371879.1 hypothetical protein [candidate division KSB1 bacterium]
MEEAITDSTAVQQMLYTFKWFAFHNDLYHYLAVLLGFFIILISYAFGGGNRNRVKIFFSIFIGVAVGLLTLPLLLRFGSDPILIGFFLFLDIVFVAAVTVHMYELVVVGTHEAFNEHH